GADFGSDGKSDGLTVARDFNLKSFALGLVDGVDELIPIINFLAVDGGDEVAIFHAGNRGRFPGNGLKDFGRHGRKAEDMFVGSFLHRDIESVDDAIMFRLNFEGAALRKSFHSAVSLIPSGILDAVDGHDLVANLQAGGIAGGETEDDDGLFKIGGVGLAGEDVVEAEEKHGENEIDGGSGKR